MEKELYDYIFKRLNEIDSEFIVNSNCSLITGPVISMIALEYIFDKRFHIKPYIHDSFFVDNVDEIANKNYLERTFSNVEQIGFSVKDEKVILTKDYYDFLKNRKLEHQFPFGFNKIIELFSWNNFLIKNGIILENNLMDVKENFYFLLKTKASAFFKTYYFRRYFYNTNFNKQDFFPLIDVNHDGACARFLPTIGINNHLLNDFLDKNQHRPSFLMNMNSVDRLYVMIDLFRKQKGTVLKNMIIAVQLEIAYSYWIIDCNEIFNKEISKKKLDKVNFFYENVLKNEHLIVKQKIDVLSRFVDFYWLIDFVFVLSKVSDQKFWGFFENIRLTQYNMNEFNKAKDFFDVIKAEYDSSVKNENIQLITPIDLDEFKGVNFVKELISKSDLIDEGESLSHCVGGYYGAVKNNTSRIFSICCKNRNSTVEFKLDNNKVVINQHKGYRNSTPHYFNRIIADNLLLFLSNEMLNKKILIMNEPDLYE